MYKTHFDRVLQQKKSAKMFQNDSIQWENKAKSGIQYQLNLACNSSISNNLQSENNQALYGKWKMQ